MSRPRFLADQDFNEHIISGVIRREPALEFARVRDVGLDRRPDSEVLAYAAAEDLLLVSHDSQYDDRRSFRASCEQGTAQRASDGATARRDRTGDRIPGAELVGQRNRRVARAGGVSAALSLDCPFIRVGFHGRQMVQQVN
jgi:hypothetical protein